MSIDPNGFTIKGPAACAKAQACYSPYGSFGVHIGDGAIAHVHNGTVRGFNYPGIGSTSPNSRLRADNLRLIGNGHGAIMGWPMATNVMADNNSKSGIVGSNGLVAQSIASSNGDTGIYCRPRRSRSLRCRRNGR